MTASSAQLQAGTTEATAGTDCAAACTQKHVKQASRKIGIRHQFPTLTHRAVTSTISDVLWAIQSADIAAVTAQGIASELNFVILLVTILWISALIGILLEAMRRFKCVEQELMTRINETCVVAGTTQINLRLCLGP